MRMGLGLLVFALDVWALGTLYGTSLSGRRKLAWSMGIVLLPLAGAAAWLLRHAGPERSPQSQS